MITALLLSATIGVVLEFNNSLYDWDVDHEMYFGQAFWRGELIWTAEFHDKLPLVQYFFAIPALFENVTVWRIISLAFGVGAAATLIYFSRSLFSNSDMFRRSAWLAAGLYFNLVVFLPGSLTNINVVASSGALIGLLLMFIFFEQRTRPKQMFGLSVLIAFFMTVSISFRPYFLFALVPAAIFLSLSFIFRPGQDSKVTKLSIVFGLGATIVVGGFGANSLPYILTGQTAAFLEGLRFIAQGLNPNSAFQSFMMQLDVGGIATGGLGEAYLSVTHWFTLVMLIVGLGSSFVSVRSRVPGAYFIALLVLSSWSLALGILTQHWWVHYSHLFSWYFAIVAAGLMTQLFQLVTRQEITTRALARAIIVLVTSLGIAAPLTLLGWDVARATVRDSTHPETWRLEAISDYLKQNYVEPVSFLSPESMYIHWKLRQPRHGFPHAANTIHISQGWWDDTPETISFLSPKNSAEYCEVINLSSADIIFAEPSAEYMKCFRSPANDGGLTFRQVIVHGEHELELWDRLG